MPKITLATSMPALMPKAAATVPEEYIDDGALMGPADRIRERYKLWANAGLTGVRLNSLNDESLEVFATVEKD